MSKAQWVTQRVIRLTGAENIKPSEALGDFPGILSIEHEKGNRWILCYDVRTIQFAAIAMALKPYLPKGWFWRWKVSWFNFEDVNNRDNLLSKGGACCNKPPRRK